MSKFIALLLLAILTGCSKAPDRYKWEVVGGQGIIRSIYIDPAALKDTGFLTELVSHLSSRSSAVQLMFFDDRAAIPFMMPMSDTAMLHWRATYNFNPHRGFERFVFIEITDAQTSPPKVREIPASIARR